MKKGAIYSLLLYLGFTSALWAQAFQDLNFEAPNVSNLAPNHSEFVSVTNGLPGWSAYIGTNQLAQVGHNWITLGDANVGLWGPNYGFGLLPLEGTYTAILQPGGFDGQGGQPAIIAQTGLIPVAAKSLRFLASLAYTNDLVVSVGGQSTPVVPLGSGSFGCDISSFTGSVEELRFSIANTHGNDLNFLDAITFSPTAIPEPSTFALTTTAVMLLMGVRSRRPRSSNAKRA